MVEDNEDDIFMMRQATRRAGLECPMHVAEDGRRAIAYLSGTDEFGHRARFPLPMMVLLDLKLPHVTGHEVIDWIRNQSALRTLLIVVLTASKAAGDIDAAYRAGANSYLVKPSSPDDLRDLVRSIAEYWLQRNEPPAIAN